VSLLVYVQPRASRNELAGVHDGRLRIRLTAPPVEGAANEALLRFLADWLEVPRSAVRIVAGDSSRRKRVVVTGLSPALTERLLRMGSPPS
jgi:uncharacterized protein (TIGR00251 family)